MKLNIYKSLWILWAMTASFQSFAGENSFPKEYSAQLVAPVLTDATHPMSALLQKLAPRMMHTQNASGTIVGANSLGQGLLFSAFHVHVGGTEVSTPTEDKFVSILKYPGFAADPASGQGRAVSIYTASGTPANLPAWVIFQPTVEFRNSIVSGYDINSIKPDSDFFVAVVANDVKMETLPMRTAKDGERVVIMGFPGENSRQLSFSTGIIVSDKDAQKARTGDVGETVPFRPGVEKMIRGYASPGFSGGAIFSLDGSFLGVVSRGTPVSAEKKGTIRFVTSPFIMSQIRAAAEQKENQAFASYIGKDFTETSSAQSIRCQSVL